MDFKNDMLGRPLRYKVLVRDMAVKKVMYNRGNGVEDVPFSEFRMSAGDLIVVRDAALGGENQVVARITKVPLAMVVCDPSATVLRDQIVSSKVEGVDNNLISHCRDRAPEDLMGYIDVEILSSDGMATLNSPFEPAAVAICNCKPAPEHYTAMLAST
jgi:hypothetical protein